MIQWSAAERLTSRQGGLARRCRCRIDPRFLQFLLFLFSTFFSFSPLCFNINILLYLQSNSKKRTKEEERQSRIAPKRPTQERSTQKSLQVWDGTFWAGSEFVRRSSLSARSPGYAGPLGLGQSTHFGFGPSTHFGGRSKYNSLPVA